MKLRIKDTPDIPCPKLAALAQDVDLAIWQAARGTLVEVGVPCSPEVVHYAVRCNSDTFWPLMGKSAQQVRTLREELGHIDGPDCKYVVCRHVLDIGD